MPRPGRMKPPNQSNRRPARGRSGGSSVELTGIEPVTSSMPWKRATNCAIAPQRMTMLAHGRLIEKIRPTALDHLTRLICNISRTTL